MLVSRRKLEALAKRSHTRCHGTGVEGYTTGKNPVLIICACVWRTLKRQGVDLQDKEEVAKRVGPEYPEEYRGTTV
jgi:hypothetical protein